MQKGNSSKTHKLLYFPIAVLFMFSFLDCAKKGNPSGGLKDSIAPVIIKNSPENFTTSFDKDQIKITFDEYIKLKDITKELLISPPLTYPPVITPTNVSKQLRINILDTLRENTTYSFNFGNSIVDNNEENIFANFKYVFSTGTYIDSLKLKGIISDALLLSPEFPTTVMLYEIDEAYKDSLVFTEKPVYITTTLGESNEFELSNLKEGTYQLIALKETGANYTFQPLSDKIGFYSEPISLPTEEVFEVKLFKEIPKFKLTRPKLESKNRIIFGYQGNGDSLKIKVLSELPDDFEYLIKKEIDSDTLNFWFKTEALSDSIVFETRNKIDIDTFTLRFRELFSDSLMLKPIKNGNVAMKDTLQLFLNTPLSLVDDTKIEVKMADTIPVPIDVSLNYKLNNIRVQFEKVEEERYKVTLNKGAVADFFGNINDSVVFRQEVKAASEFASIQLNLENAQSFPYIVELVDDKFKIIDSKYTESETLILFENIDPGNYFIRLILDSNQNKKWDTGDFLSRKAPERIIYYPTIIELRSNFSFIETFMLE
jgi:uncharacterized protein (DUF2141 family)